MLGYGHGAYRLLPDPSARVAVESAAAPKAVSAADSNEATIASFNLRRFLDDSRAGSEPVLNAAHPLIAMDNAVCTPHIGYVEQAGYESQFASSFGQIIAYLEGKPMNVINPEALGHLRK